MLSELEYRNICRGFEDIMELPPKRDFINDMLETFEIIFELYIIPHLYFQRKDARLMYNCEYMLNRIVDTAKRITHTNIRCELSENYFDNSRNLRIAIQDAHFSRDAGHIDLKII